MSGVSGAVRCCALVLPATSDAIVNNGTREATRSRLRSVISDTLTQENPDPRPHGTDERLNCPDHHMKPRRLSAAISVLLGFVLHAMPQEVAFEVASIKPVDHESHGKLQSRSPLAIGQGTGRPGP